MTRQYSATYIRPGFFGRKVQYKNVIGDGFVADAPVRFFELSDGQLIHFPSFYEVVFSKERRIAVLDKLSKDAGQPVQGA